MRFKFSVNVYFSTIDYVTFPLFNPAGFIRLWMMCQSAITFHRQNKTLCFSNNMTKSINQSNFHKVELTGSERSTIALLLWLNNNPNIRWNADSVLEIFCISVFASAFYATELLSWAKSGEYRNKWRCELSFLLLFIRLCATLIYPKTDLTSIDTVSVFGTVLFELGVQRWVLEKLEIQY